MSRKRNVPNGQAKDMAYDLKYFLAHKFDIFTVIRGNVAAIKCIQEFPAIKLAIEQKGGALRWGDVFPSATMLGEKSIHEILEVSSEEKKLKQLLEVHALWRMYKNSDDLTPLDGFNTLSDSIPSFESYFKQCMILKRRLTKESGAVQFLDLLWICNTQISIITFYATLNAPIPGSVDIVSMLEKCLERLNVLFKAFLANITQRN